MPELPHEVKTTVGPIPPDVAKTVDSQLDYAEAHGRSRMESAARYARSTASRTIAAVLRPAPPILGDYPHRLAWETVAYHREALWLAADGRAVSS